MLKIVGAYSEYKESLGIEMISESERSSKL